MPNKNNELYWRLFVFTRKQLLMAVAIFFGSLLIVILAIIPQINTIKTANTKLDKEQKELEKITGKYKELEQIKLSPEFAQSEKIDAILPSKKPLLELMAGINNVAALSQVAVAELQINPGEIATSSAQLKQSARQQAVSFDSIEINITVIGQLNSIQDFMVMIEQISPITTITKISLSQNGTKQSDVVLTTAQLTLQTHYFTQQIKTTLTSNLPKISQREKEIFQTIQSFTIAEPDAQDSVEGGGLTDPFSIERIPSE